MIKNQYETEIFRLPTVLIVGLLSAFLQALCGVFSKSAGLLGFGGLILAVAFSAMPLIANTKLNTDSDETLKRSQFYSVFFNSLMLLIISAYLVYRSIVLLKSQTVEIVFLSDIVRLFISISFFGLVFCSFLLRNMKNLRGLFYKYIFCSCFSAIILLLCFSGIFEQTGLTDALISLCSAVCILVQTVFLMKHSLFVLLK